MNKLENELNNIIRNCLRNVSGSYEQFRQLSDRKHACIYLLDNKHLYKLLYNNYPEEFKHVIRDILKHRLEYDKSLKEKFLRISDSHGLAAFFEVSYPQLLFTLGLIKERSSPARYTEFTIPKKIRRNKIYKRTITEIVELAKIT